MEDTRILTDIRALLEEVAVELKDSEVPSILLMQMRSCCGRKLLRKGSMDSVNSKTLRYLVESKGMFWSKVGGRTAGAQMLYHMKKRGGKHVSLMQLPLHTNYNTTDIKAYPKFASRS